MVGDRRLAPVAFVLFALAVPVSTSAQSLLLGTEFQVNEYTAQQSGLSRLSPWMPTATQ